MTKLFKNSKQILAFVFAFAVIAVSLFTGNAAADITAEAACDVSKIDYWDGTKASSFAGGTGTESDPYIIKTAEQLAFCCFGQDATTSKGKYYKVDDSIDIFVMQPQNFVDLEVIDCEPGIQGDTSKSTNKPAKVESGYTLQVPLFINIGDRIRIDTRDGSYMDRIK